LNFAIISARLALLISVTVLAALLLTLSAPAANAQGRSSQSANDAMSLLLEQNKQLQAEIQALRGQLDEQGFEIKKLQRDSLNRYTDVDQRLSDLEAAPAPSTSAAQPRANPNSIAGGAGEVSPTRSSVQPPQAGSTRPRPALEPAVLSEQQRYQLAYDSVINSQFERSIAEFNQYLELHPQGRFVANAHYWKGQAYLYLDRFEEARAAYEIILERYSDSNKLPDAMYGLGLAYQGMGNIQRARQLLTDIKRRFPNTGVANLADTRLLSL
jgi:tol-pal system protein YbgF